MSQGDKKSLLAFGTTPSFPAIVDHGNPLKGNQYIEGRIDKLQEEYDALVKLVQDTTRVENAAIGVTPIIGKKYYLYNNKGQDVMSMIAPEEWTNNTRPDYFIACFKLTTDGVWRRYGEDNEEQFES